MKTRKTITQSLALLSALFFSATAVLNSNGQTIVEDTNIELVDFFLGDPSIQQLTIYQTVSSTPGDFTNVLFNVQPAPSLPIFPPLPVAAALTGTAIALDEGADLYIAEAGELFSLNIASTENFQPLFVNGVPSSDTISEGDFFLAIATTGTDINLAPTAPDRDVFGWARLNLDDQFNITLLDNAVAYGTGNIIIGQNAFAVPEPSSSIALLALFGLGVPRRRK